MRYTKYDPLIEDLIDLDTIELIKEIMLGALIEVERLKYRIDRMNTDANEGIYFNDYGTETDPPFEAPNFDDVISFIYNINKLLTIADALIDFHKIEKRLIKWMIIL